MINAIVIAIKPSSAEKIYEGRKTVECRSVDIKQWYRPIFLYETSPVKMVTGYILVKDHFVMDKNDILLVHDACLDKDKFGARELRGYRIARYHRFEEPITLDEVGVNGCVQSIRYLERIPENVRNMMEDDGGCTC